MFNGKYIQKIKLAITNLCNFRCKHCKVDKSKVEILDIEMVKKWIYAFLSQNDNEKFKRIEIYGGEPLLLFEKTKIIIDFAINNNIIFNRSLSISIATNLSLLNETHIEYFKKRNINISVSYNGTEESHNYTRVLFDNKKKSFTIVYKNLKKILKNYDPENIVILNCVHPNRSSSLYEDFIYSIQMGAIIFNIECIHGPYWNKNSINNLEKNILKIIDHVKKLINKNRFIYLESFLEFLRLQGLRNEIVECPFYRDFEIYPDGSFALYPYPFVHSLKNIIKKITIGDIYNGITSKDFKKCHLSSNFCKLCKKKYYFISSFKTANLAYMLRTNLLKNAFTEIVREAKSNPNYRKYINNAYKILLKHYSAK